MKQIITWTESKTEVPMPNVNNGKAWKLITAWPSSREGISIGESTLDLIKGISFLWIRED